MTKASDQEKRMTRELLLTAAQEEIADSGWGGVRTRAVAERAGVNNGLVHYHFGSIDELKLRALEAALTSAAEESMSSAMAAPTAAGIVRGIGAALADFGSDSIEWKVMAEGFVHATRDPAVAEVALGLIDMYREVAISRLDLAVADGELPVGTDTEALAGALLALLDGVALHHMMIPDLDVSRIVSSFASLLENPED